MQPDQQPTPQPQPAPEAPQPTPTPSPEVPQTDTPTPTAQPPVAPNNKKKLPLWAKILLISFGSVVGLIGLAILGFYLYANMLISEPMKISQQFVDAAQANDPSAAYNLTSSEFKRVTKEERLKSIFDQINSEIQGEEKVSDKQYKIWNGVKSSTVIYSIPTNNGPTYVRVVLREKNDKWEVISMFTSKKELKADTN